MPETPAMTATAGFRPKGWTMAVVLETARGLGLHSDLFVPPAAASLAEALDRGDLVQDTRSSSASPVCCCG